MSRHTCHAHGCKTPVPPRLFMCLSHWRKVPSRVKRAVWREYRPGQENDKRPSVRYLAVQQLAIGAVAFVPNDQRAAADAAPYLLRASILRHVCVKVGVGDPLADVAALPPLSAEKSAELDIEIEGWREVGGDPPDE